MDQASEVRPRDALPREAAPKTRAPRSAGASKPSANGTRPPSARPRPRAAPRSPVVTQRSSAPRARGGGGGACPRGGRARRAAALDVLEDHETAPRRRPAPSDRPEGRPSGRCRLRTPRSEARAPGRAAEAQPIGCAFRGSHGRVLRCAPGGITARLRWPVRADTHGPPVRRPLARMYRPPALRHLSSVVCGEGKRSSGPFFHSR